MIRTSGETSEGDRCASPSKSSKDRKHSEKRRIAHPLKSLLLLAALHAVV
jgi:hypothetical protein